MAPISNIILLYFVFSQLLTDGIRRSKETIYSSFFFSFYMCRRRHYHRHRHRHCCRSPCCYCCSRYCCSAINVCRSQRDSQPHMHFTHIKHALMLTHHIKSRSTDRKRWKRNKQTNGFFESFDYLLINSSFIRIPNIYLFLFI